MVAEGRDCRHEQRNNGEDAGEPYWIRRVAERDAEHDEHHRKRDDRRDRTSTGSASLRKAAAWTPIVRDATTRAHRDHSSSRPMTTTRSSREDRRQAHRHNQLEDRHRVRLDPERRAADEMLKQLVTVHFPAARSDERRETRRNQGLATRSAPRRSRAYAGLDGRATTGSSTSSVRPSALVDDPSISAARRSPARRTR